MELLKATLEANRDTIVVMMTGNPSVSSSVEALRAGAWDYLPKPFSATHLQILIGRAAHAVMVARESRQQQAKLEAEHGNSEKVAVLGVAPAFRRAIELARKVAATLQDLAKEPVPSDDDAEDFLPPVLRCWTRRVPGTALAIMFDRRGDEVRILALRIWP